MQRAREIRNQRMIAIHFKNLFRHLVFFVEIAAQALALTFHIIFWRHEPNRAVFQNF